ncbi:hypothetical protein ACFB49_39660 [Sphingomonas sp. DBB INV C78]
MEGRGKEEKRREAGRGKQATHLESFPFAVRPAPRARWGWGARGWPSFPKTVRSGRSLGRAGNFQKRVSSPMRSVRGRSGVI